MVIGLERVNVRTLLLELTRKCNLECKHCFRGDSQNIYMNKEIINYIFNNVCRINTLLLTGGEPLLALEQLKCIRDNIMKDLTNINKVSIVTNGTVLSLDIIDILNDISTRAYLEIDISDDKFHDLEIYNKGLERIKERNKKLFDKNFCLLNGEQHKVYLVHKIGRAKNLTEQELDKINENSNVKYILGTEKALSNYRDKYPLPTLSEDNVIEGTLNIDVHGNITPTFLSYSEEDMINYNVKNYKSLKLAIKNMSSKK